MATKKPLAIYNGITTQMPTTDILDIGGLTMEGALIRSAVVTQSNIPGSASVNDVAFTGFSTAYAILQPISGGGVNTVTFTGFAGGVDGREFLLVNTSSDATTMVLAIENAGSVAANRISGISSSIYITAGGAAKLRYDGTASRWRVISVLSTQSTITQISAALSISGVLSTSAGAFGGPNAFTNIISPTAITGAQNNYNPTNIGSCSVVRQDLTANASLTGLTAAVSNLSSNSGRILYLFNIHASFTLTLNHENASSTAANRFSLPGAVDYVIPALGGVILMYDSTSSRWRIAGRV